VLASALCVKCGPTGPPRPSEGEGVGTLGRGTPQRLPRDSLCFFELFPVVAGRGTPRGVRGPPHRPASVNRGSSRQRAAGRPVRPPVSSPARLRPPLRLLRRHRRSVRPFGVEPGSAFFAVFTTSWSSRLRNGLHDFPPPNSIPNVATLQRLEGVAVDVLTSRTWFCRSSLRAV
jgi:hypothetical protein